MGAVCIWAGLEEACSLSRWSAGTRSCVVAETVEDLAPQGSLCVSCEKRDAEQMMQGRSDETEVPVGGGGGGSPCEPSFSACDLVKFEGDAVSLCRLGQKGVQCFTPVEQEIWAVDG